MGTRADFYSGRGESAEWLGSIAWDGYPDAEDIAFLLKAKSDKDWRERVGAMLDKRDDATTPDLGWPWPWEDSRTTDWAYAFDGEVYGACFGRGWYTAEEMDGGREDDEEREKQAFPDMSAIQKPAMGTKRDSIMFVTAK